MFRLHKYCSQEVSTLRNTYLSNQTIWPLALDWRSVHSFNCPWRLCLHRFLWDKSCKFKTNILQIPCANPDNPAWELFYESSKCETSAISIRTLVSRENVDKNASAIRCNNPKRFRVRFGSLLVLVMYVSTSIDNRKRINLKPKTKSRQKLISSCSNHCI